MNKIPNRDDYKSFMAIDFHTHTGTDLTLASATERGHIASDVPSLIDSMNRAGISRSVTFNQPIPEGKHREWNYELAKEITNYNLAGEYYNGKPRLIQFAFMNPWDSDSPNLLEDLVKNHKIKGVKLHPLFDKYPDNFNRIVAPETMPMFEVATKYDLPVAVHSGWKVHVESILKLAKTFPKMTVGVLHMMDGEDYFQCAGHDNVFVETSYANHPRRIRQIVEKLGSERIVYGSDYAWSDQLVEKMKVLRLPLPDKDIENILYKNAERILKL